MGHDPTVSARRRVLDDPELQRQFHRRLRGVLYRRYLLDGLDLFEYPTLAAAYFRARCRCETWPTIQPASRRQFLDRAEERYRNVPSSRHLRRRAIAALRSPRSVETVGDGPAVNIEGLTESRWLRQLLRPGQNNRQIGYAAKSLVTGKTVNFSMWQRWAIVLFAEITVKSFLSNSPLTELFGL